eukprot:CAMPEP_0117531524 /NCGR_PEP_ID=MMETSP0784-20121206/38903_1 /TAXON_ID=39447 /ORGANISM="" /LENGTH=181 /DNA_ID=CAMNT_0005327901 /DNA_START=280 /DNA_END=822 /DNA_ORIENTATION=+
MASRPAWDSSTKNSSAYWARKRFNFIPVVSKNVRELCDKDAPSWLRRRRRVSTQQGAALLHDLITRLTSVPILIPKAGVTMPSPISLRVTFLLHGSLSNLKLPIFAVLPLPLLFAFLLWDLRVNCLGAPRLTRLADALANVALGIAIVLFFSFSVLLDVNVADPAHVRPAGVAALQRALGL